MNLNNDEQQIKKKVKKEMLGWNHGDSCLIGYAIVILVGQLDRKELPLYVIKLGDLVFIYLEFELHIYI